MRAHKKKQRPSRRGGMQGIEAQDLIGEDDELVPVGVELPKLVMHRRTRRDEVV